MRHWVIATLLISLSFTGAARADAGVIQLASAAEADRVSPASWQKTVVFHDWPAAAAKQMNRAIALIDHRLAVSVVPMRAVYAVNPPWAPIVALRGNVLLINGDAIAHLSDRRLAVILLHELSVADPPRGDPEHRGVTASR